MNMVPGKFDSARISTEPNFTLAFITNMFEQLIVTRNRNLYPS